MCTPLKPCRNATHARTYIHHTYIHDTGQNKLLALNYLYPGEDQAVCAAHMSWGKAFQAAHSAQRLPEVQPTRSELADDAPGRRLRVRLGGGRRGRGWGVGGIRTACNTL